MPNFLIIDGNALGNAAHGTTPLTVDDMEVQAVFQGLKMLKSAKERFPRYESLLWLWDGRAQWRYDLYPEYKGKRSDTPEKRENKEKYKQAVPYLQRAINALGINQVTAPDFEADDLAGYFARRVTERGEQAMLLTGDKDWLQLVRGNIGWYDPREKIEKHCTKATFKEYTGFDGPAQFLEAKAIQGDTSDCITGVGGLGEKAASLIISHFGSVRNLLALYKENGGVLTKEQMPEGFGRYMKNINALCGENRKLFVRNYRLMNLNDATRDSEMKASARVERGKRDFEAFASLCEELRFMSILRELRAWQQLF
jgi:DNA polymerase I